MYMHRIYCFKKYRIRYCEDTNQNWNLIEIRERTYICTSIIKVRVKTIIKVVQIKCLENQKKEICDNKPSTQLVIQRNISEYIEFVYLKMSKTQMEMWNKELSRSNVEIPNKKVVKELTSIKCLVCTWSFIHFFHRSLQQWSFKAKKIHCDYDSTE